MQIFKDALAGFDYSDFVEGDEPYQMLDDAAVDASSQARYQAMLEKRAQQCGVPIRTVREIIKGRHSYTASVGSSEGRIYFDWEGQPLTLRCGKYIQDGPAVCYEDKYGVEIICSHPIIPTRRYVNIETGTESLEISFKREQWKSIIVDRGKLANSATIIQLADHGVSVTSETARAMVKFLAYVDDLNRDIIPIDQMSSHLGWINGHEFVPYVQNVAYDGQGAFLQMFKTIHEKGDYQRWLDVVREIRAAGCIQARIVIAASFASVLLSKFDALPFFVHLWSAQSGTGKTVTMEVAASVWADPQVGAYCRPLKATSVGLEQLAIFTCHMPLCLDELQTIQGKASFDDIIYSLCEGSGKTRGAKNGGLRQSPGWKNCIITTGEMPIVFAGSKAGAVNRVVEIECSGPMLPNAKEVHKEITANYGFAGRRFVEALQDAPTLDGIEHEQQEIFTRLSEIGTDKQALSASIILAADHAAERVIFKDGVALADADILPYLKTAHDVDSGRRAHEYLLDWITENRQGFIFNGDPETVKGRSLLGCIETDKDGHATNVWIVAKSFSQALVDGGFSADSYLSWAAGQGLIRCDGKGQRRVTKRMPGCGVVARCIWLMPEACTDGDNGFQLVFDENLPF